MASYREQTLIEAPVDTVWGQVGNPNTYPDWAGEVVEISGLGEVEQRAHFEQKTKTPLGTSTTLEVGMSPKTIGYTAVDKTVGRRWYRKTVNEMLGRLRERLQ